MRVLEILIEALYAVVNLLHIHSWEQITITRTEDNFGAPVQIAYTCVCRRCGKIRVTTWRKGDK